LVSKKKKYLQGKRGIEKPPFDLPTFIKETGIMELRGAILDKDSDKKLKQKMRERINPSMGKMDIDYQVLHDAFFAKQTKPRLTLYGDLYYEGKEFDVEMKEKRPGFISKELREALGMIEGHPPPWIENMRRFGPPPAYPKLKIPGKNAPSDYDYSYKFERTGPIEYWGEVFEEEEETAQKAIEEEDSKEDENVPMETVNNDEEDENGIQTPSWMN